MPSHDSSAEPVQVTVGEQHAGWRLDAFLAQQFPRYSRVQLRRAVTEAGVQVDGRRAKPAYRLRQGQKITVILPEPPAEGPQPEPIPLEILYEDEHVVAINKPARMVVHPAKGHWQGTLASALAYHFQRLSQVGGTTRPGIVHRLDRDTSGVLVVAKTDQAHLALASQFESRSVAKEYLAVVRGVPDRDRDLIEQPIGVHPYQREKMAIRSRHRTSRLASTFYEVLERFRGYAVVRVEPRTGRTHQVRVHLAHIGCPVLCDRLYGGQSRITVGQIRGTSDQTVLISRQALHAHRLKLTHPATGRPLHLEAPLPDDIQTVINQLRRYLPPE